VAAAAVAVAAIAAIVVTKTAFVHERIDFSKDEAPEELRPFCFSI
jgi:hypothetical protein